MSIKFTLKYKSAVTGGVWRGSNAGGLALATGLFENSLNTSKYNVFNELIKLIKQDPLLCLFLFLFKSKMRNFYQIYSEI